MNKQNIDKYINEHLDDFSIMKTSDFMLQCFNDLGLSNEWVSRDSSKPCPEGGCEFNAYNKHVSALRRENAELIKELADLKASLPKLRADAFIDGAAWERESRFHKDIETEAEAYAIKLEQGND